MFTRDAPIFQNIAVVYVVGKKSLGGEIGLELGVVPFNMLMQSRRSSAAAGKRP